MTAEGSPFRIDWRAPPPLERRAGAWSTSVDGRAVRLTNLDKVFWPDEGYTKGDVVAYYHTVAAAVLPFVADRPLTMKRMPDGVAGDFFYAKQAPPHTPGWIRTEPVEAVRSGARIDYVVATDRASLLWLANLGCIELHPWHSRTASLGAPDYALFDLDPFGVDFAVVRDVALHVRALLDQLGLRSYPRTSGATGMQVHVPIDPVHDYGDVRAFVERCSVLIHRADPRRTTMEWDVGRRDGRVFLDHNMNVEGKNIAATWSLRPEPGASVATPLRWEEVADDVRPSDFTIETVHAQMAARQALGLPIVEGGQDLHAASAALGLPEPGPVTAHHRITAVAGARAADERDRAARLPAGRRQRDDAAGDDGAGDLRDYQSMRDFGRTPEPRGASPGADDGDGPPRFVVQHHLASRLHHDLRLERGGTLRSWAVPKGLPLVRDARHLAVQTEDHPLEYLDFSGDIPAGGYGAGPMRIWDRGEYDVREWTDDKVTFRLHGHRHHGVWHLFRTRDAEPGQWLVTRVDDGLDVPAPAPRIEPMLAVAADAPFDDDEWSFEIKWDGVRAVATTTRPGLGRPAGTLLRTRRGNDVTGTYPELRALWERVLAWEAVLDGEVVTFSDDGRPSFERLQRRMNVRDERMAARLSAQLPVSYLVFDVLWVDGEDLTAAPLAERRRRLDDLLVPGGPLRRSDPLGPRGRDVFAAADAARLEGVVGKRVRSVYRPGRRSADWVKIKVRRTIDCVIGGWLPKADAPAGNEPYSLLVGLWNDDALRWVARVGSGLTERERTALTGLLRERARASAPFDATHELPDGAHWVEPELVCAVEYAEVTEGGFLRAPTYRGRRGVDPRTCLLTDLHG